MSGLLSIAPLSETVEVVGTPIVVSGVSIRGVVVLLERFDSLKSLITGREVAAQDLIATAPDAVAAIIAAGIGFPGDADQEAAADRLLIDAQVDLLAAILRVTFPNGPGAIIEKVTALIGSVIPASAAVPATAPATNSPKPPKA